MDRHPQLTLPGHQHPQLPPATLQFNQSGCPQAVGSGARASPRLVFPVGCPGLGNYRSGAVPRLGTLGARWRLSFGVPQWAPPRTSPGTRGAPGSHCPGSGWPRQHQGMLWWGWGGTGGWARAGGALRGSSPPLGSAPGAQSRFWLVQPELPQQSPGQSRDIPGQPSLPGYPTTPACTQGVTSLLGPHSLQSPGLPGTPWAGVWPCQGSGLACPPCAVPSLGSR